MGIFNFFKKKKELPPELEKEPERPFKHLCGSCQQPIYEGDSWTKNAMGRYHRKCWREMEKLV